MSDVLWSPSAARVDESNITRYLGWLAENRRLKFRSYASLWRWSVDDLAGFWSSIAEYCDIRFQRPASEILAYHDLMRARWFSGATLNYAENALREAGDQTQPAILFENEKGDRLELSRAELRDQTARVAAELRRMGVRRGDRVAGFLPNIPETVVAFLATASIGAIWTNCPVELGSRAVLDRLTQVRPKLLIAATSYRYAGKTFDLRQTVKEVAEGLDELERLVLVGAFEQLNDRSIGWSSLLEKEASDLVFEPVPFEHPLWILYSSGTTGLPKAIVQGHGGILLEHAKALTLHLDLKAGDRFFWFTSSGWMMWNFLVSGLLLKDVTIVLYDGSPKYPDFSVLWELAERLQISYFGASAPYFMACGKAGLIPKASYRLEPLHGIGSTGAPLPPEGFEWIYENVKADVLLGSVSGGTDVCTAFVLSNPLLPVAKGKLQCLGLGAKIEAWNDQGESVFGEVGELVLTAPFPSMPIFFWNDENDSRLKASYYEKFPGIWAHGDWIEIDAPGGPCTIHGRSDATLNRGGVRMGTAEFYSILEKIPEIEDSLIIDTNDRLVLFLVLTSELTDALIERIKANLKSEVSPRHVPDFIYRVPEIPRTLNGKKLEIPVKRILSGVPVDQAVNRSTVVNPEALNHFANLS